ncbi:hypothetical protein NQ317_019317 [Molorchus minor]|uniref:Uncharacterized protein n=1 Tax=Molorchus minor TaxID=1323400 RepID=A0ABQ9J4H0_9CUCU|nr:hypothetical protein NQ317_019317 [Molorchus minor]
MTQKMDADIDSTWDKPHSENARIPRSLECELMEDLVKSCIPGDDITITGIIKGKTTTPKQNCLDPYTSAASSSRHWIDIEGAFDNTFFNLVCLVLERRGAEPSVVRDVNKAVSVNNPKQQNKGSYTPSEGITLNMNDYYFIQGLHYTNKKL